MHAPIARPQRGLAPARQVAFSRAARTAIVDACRRGSRQVVVLSWPAGATYLPRDCYQPGAFDVVIGHIAGCPVYADVRRLALFRDQRVLLDAERPTAVRPHPALRARPLPAPRPTDRARPADRTDRAGEHVVVEPAAARVSRELVADLTRQFAGVHPPDIVRAAVRRALQDLRGSVHVEALPEMATRLVHHRLAHDSCATAS
jgi:hypothetical protein